MSRRIASIAAAGGPAQLGFDAASFPAHKVNAGAPRVTGVALTSDPGPDASYAPGERIEATVSFDVPVSLSPAAAASLALNLRVGGVGMAARYAGGSGTRRLSFRTGALAAAQVDADGVRIGADALALEGGARLRSAIGVDAGLAHGARHFPGHRVNTAAPVLASAGVDGTALTLAYDKALDADSRPGPGAFAVTVAGAARTVDAVEVSGTAVTLTLASAAIAEQAVTLAYTPGAHPIQDAAGTDAEVIAAMDVTNATAAKVTAIAITTDPGADGSYATGERIDVTVTFDAPVSLRTGAMRIPLDIGGVSKSFGVTTFFGNTREFVLRSPVLSATDVDTDGVSLAANALALTGNAATLRSASGIDADLGHGAVHFPGHRVNAPGPVVRSAGVDAATLTLVYSRVLDGNSTPGPGAFTVTVGDAPRTVGAVTIAGSAVTLTLAPAVTAADRVTVAYAVPGTQPVQDRGGIDALAIAPAMEWLYWCVVRSLGRRVRCVHLCLAAASGWVTLRTTLASWQTRRHVPDIGSGSATVLPRRGVSVVIGETRQPMSVVWGRRTSPGGRSYSSDRPRRGHRAR